MPNPTWVAISRRNPRRGVTIPHLEWFDARETATRLLGTQHVTLVARDAGESVEAALHRAQQVAAVQRPAVGQVARADRMPTVRPGAARGLGSASS
jgi:hypothetical protein